MLVAGATGYVGGRLIRPLHQAGYNVRAMSREPEFLNTRPGLDGRVMYGDILDPGSLDTILSGVDVAIYLVQTLGTEGAEEEDRLGAQQFAEAASKAGVKRIVYLGALANTSKPLPPHVASRIEVGNILRTSTAQVIELQSPMILGSGSLAFDLVRGLAEKIPVVICPRWYFVKHQPLAVEDLIGCLMQAVQLPGRDNAVYELGGGEEASLFDVLREYIRQKELKRALIPIPFMNAWVDSRGIAVVTPIYARVARKFIQNLKHPTLARDEAARRDLGLKPMGIAKAVARALGNEDQSVPETRWSNPMSSAGPQQSWAGIQFGSRFMDARMIHVKAGPSLAFHPIQRIGGKTGWYSWDILWRLRAYIDLLAGGVGMRRGRPHPEILHVGDPVDFWRVEIFEQDRRLKLQAEMKLPGRAWLDFEVVRTGNRTMIHVTAIFDPNGALGRLYWFAMYPFHHLIFGAMLKNIVKAIPGE